MLIVLTGTDNYEQDGVQTHVLRVVKLALSHSTNLFVFMKWGYGYVLMHRLDIYRQTNHFIA